MDEELRGFGEELVDVLERATALAAQLPAQRHRLAGAELGRVAAALGRCRVTAEAGLFTVTHEAQDRGEVAASQAGSTADWLAGHVGGDPAVSRGVARSVLRLSQERYAAVRLAVMTGRISAAVGVTVRTELDALRPMLREGAEEAVLEGLLTMGASHGCAGVRGLRPALLARYGLGEELQDQDDRQVGGTSLSLGRDLGGGLSQYHLRLGAVEAAILEAALNQLTKPQPAAVDEESRTDRCASDGGDGRDHPGGACAGAGAGAGAGAVFGGVGVGGALGAGEAAEPGGSAVVRDPRTIEQRRGEALVELCRRATALTSTPATAAGVKSCVVVTIDLHDLRERTGGGTVVGGIGTGSVLGPETVRRLACDAGVLPVVLGTAGEVLDVGRTVRLFTPGQVKALWVRDRHCTFPGCTAPPMWCDAHHLTHWIDGGPTSLGNAALLCARHHTIVHRDRLHGRLAAGAVVWDRIPGSYDRAQTATDDHGPPHLDDGRP